MQTARDRLQRETSGYFRINKQQRQLAKERTKRQTRNLCDLKIADYAETLKIGEFFQRRLARNSAGMLCIPCGDVDKPTSVEGGTLTSEKKFPEAEMGQTKEEARALM